MLSKSDFYRKSDQAYKNKANLNNNELMAYAVALSRINGVKPMVLDNLCVAIEELSNGERIFNVATNFVENINEDLKFQHVINKLKPVYDSFLSHITDYKNYKFMTSLETDSNYEDDMYDDWEGVDPNSYYNRLQKDKFLIEKSYKNCKNEIKKFLIDNGCFNNDSFEIRQTKSMYSNQMMKIKFIDQPHIYNEIHFKDEEIDYYIEEWVKNFFKSQTRAFDFYNFSKFVCEKCDSDRIFVGAPKYQGSPNIVRAIEKLNCIVGSSLVYTLSKTDNLGMVSNESKKTFGRLIDDFATCKGIQELQKHELFKEETKQNFYLTDRLIDNFVDKGSVFDNALDFQLKNISNPAKVLYFERLLQMKYLQGCLIGSKAKPVKVYLDKDENGNEVKKVVVEKGDLMHMAFVKNGHIQSIVKDKALVAEALLDKEFSSNRFGDACFGSVHFAVSGQNFNNFKEYTEDNEQSSYFKTAMIDTYNTYGDKAGFVFDGELSEIDSQFDLMHTMDDLQVDERCVEICRASASRSSGYYSEVAGNRFESNRLLYDQAYWMGVSLNSLKHIYLCNGAWQPLSAETVDTVKDVFENKVPIFANGVLVNNPPERCIEIVDKDYIATSNAELSGNGKVENTIDSPTGK